MKELLGCSEWLPYSKNLELVSGNYKLKYSDDNEVVYARYCAFLFSCANVCVMLINL